MPNTLKLQHHAFLFGALLLLWLLLTGSLRLDEILTGILVAIIVSLVSAPYIHIFEGIRFTPTALISAFRYLGFFFVELVLANFDMARRVVSPSLPISPGLVEVETQLKSDLGQMLLANSITLTPGTLSVDIVNDRILVHWIAAPEGINLEQATKDIAAGFEKHISGFLK